MLFELPYSFFPIIWVIAYVWLLLLAHDRLNGVWRVELSGVMSANHLHQQYKASSHFDHTFSTTQFYCIRSILTHCMIRINNMWVLGSSWWGSTYYLFIIKPLGVTITLCLYCHAMLVDVDWVWVNPWQMWDCYIMVQLQVATLIHIWVDWGTWVTQWLPVFLWKSRGTMWFSYGPPPRLKGIMRLFMLETSVCSRKLLWALA